MKQKALSFLRENKGGISLFLITLLATLVFSLPFGGIRGSIVGGCFGTLALIGTSYLAGKVGMQLGDSDRPGITGIVIGILISAI